MGDRDVSDGKENGVCIDMGTVGEEKPDIVMRTGVYTPRNQMHVFGLAMKERYTSVDLEKTPVSVQAHYPMEHGKVTNWDHIEHLWNEISSKLPMNSVPLFVSERVCNPVANREKQGEVLFEKFGPSSIHFEFSSILNLQASGQSSGLVVDIGEGVTTLTPIVEGMINPHAVIRRDYGGRDLSRDIISKILMDQSLGGRELEIAEMFKEQCAQAAIDPVAEKMRCSNEHVKFELPDGEEIEIGSMGVETGELLFAPIADSEMKVGIPKMVSKVLKKSDIFVRKRLKSNIILAGGTCNMKGFEARLSHDLQKCVAKGRDIKLNKVGTNATWTGLSICGSLSNFKDAWITKAQYEEFGSSIFTKDGRRWDLAVVGKRRKSQQIRIKKMKELEKERSFEDLVFAAAETNLKKKKKLEKDRQFEMMMFEAAENELIKRESSQGSMSSI